MPLAKPSGFLFEEHAPQQEAASVLEGEDAAALRADKVKGLEES